MRVPIGPHRLGEALSDGTGLTQEELGWLVAAAAVASGVVVALRAADLVSRLWTPSGARS
jgi:hypothetical protein